jgi:hypothetical protein
VLVGCKADLRVDPLNSLPLVSFEEATQVAKDIGAKGYIECSAQTGWNVLRVLDSLCWFTIARRESKGCIIC